MLRTFLPNFDIKTALVRSCSGDLGMGTLSNILCETKAPGADDISLAENTITVQGTSNREEKEEQGNYYRCEISRGTFSRSIVLPSDVDEEKVKATFKDGMLELTLPKVEKSKQRSIKVEFFTLFKTRFCCFFYSVFANPNL